MPDFPIIDTHVHLWDQNVLSYPGLEGNEKLNRPYLPADFDIACGNVQVEKIVFLEVDVPREESLAEARWVASLARQDRRIEGIVAGAALEDETTVRSILEKLKEISLIKGIRRITQGEPDVAFCLRPNFVKGVQMLAEFDFSCDLCIHHPQLKNTVQLVKQCPQVRFILDHIGKPGIKNGILEPWKTELVELARLPNVVCKVSGVATEADHESWTWDDVRPYLDHVFETFGFDRVVYGGDWPVASLATEIPRWVETIDRVIEGASPDEKRKLYRDNAIDFYRL
jgi:L-fuconolactonase